MKTRNNIVRLVVIGIATLSLLGFGWAAFLLAILIIAAESVLLIAENTGRVNE